MKAHEEKWRVRRGVLVSGNGDETSNVFYEKNVDAPEHMARARLAAQAPAMARLLLEGLTVTAAAEENHHTCLARCGGYGPAVEHAPDCRLVAVLRAAGVL